MQQFSLRLLAFFSLICLAACGYHIDRSEKVAISVPYVIGDHEGALTEALARAISRTANFQYSKDDGDWILKAKVLRTNNDRIGYRYDRDPKSGKLRKNIIGTENRKEISVEVSVMTATLRVGKYARTSLEQKIGKRFRWKFPLLMPLREN